jgi:hypothetical protein
MSALTDWIAATGQWASALATTAAVVVALGIARRDYRRQRRTEIRTQANKLQHGFFQSDPIQIPVKKHRF